MLQVGLAERIALCFVLFLEREFHCIIKLSSGSLCSLDCPPNSPHPASALQVLGLQNATIPSLHQGERGLWYLAGQNSHREQCRASHPHSDSPAAPPVLLVLHHQAAVAGEHITCLTEELEHLVCVQRAVQGEVPRAAVDPCQRR